MLSKDSRGRQIPEPDHPMRTCFQRDRDRIVHCAAFRRLEYKTQVFVNHEGDYYRTRLTHTIEAADDPHYRARSRAQRGARRSGCARARPGAYAVAHAGEKVLNELMRPYGGFDHNAQSLRTIDWIQVRYPNFRGLNLSFEVREGIIKHSHFHDRPAAQEFDPSTYPCLEAQIVDLADEIAYLGHYVDDGLKAGMLSADELDCRNFIARRTLPRVPQSRPMSAAVSSAIKPCEELLMRMATDLMNNLDADIRAMKIESVEDVRRAGRALALFSPAMAAAGV